MPPGTLNWRDEYLANLRAAYAEVAVNEDLFQACSDLSERLSTIQAEKALLELELRNDAAAAAPPPASKKRAPPVTTSGPAADGSADSATPSSSDSPTAVAQLRVELAEALRSKTSLHARAKAAEEDVARLRARITAESRALRETTTEKQTLARRCRDLDWELKEKRKLVADVQDEMLALNIQLTLKEKETDKYRDENKALVTRLLKYKEQEADAMNLSNERLPQ